MEEIRARKAVDASGSGDGGLVEESDKLSIVIHGGIKPESQSTNSGGVMQEYFQSLESAENKQLKHENPKIQRIPITLRDNENIKKHYAPRVISIGPLHHGDSKFKVTDQLKLKLAARFIRENDIQKEDLYKKIVTKIEDLKSCYNPEDIKERGFEDQKLAWMFLVDGCAILYYIYCHTLEKTEELKIKDDEVVFAHQDIFLLENQLPFQLLNLIMENCPFRRNELLRKSIDSFIDKIVLQTRAYQFTESEDKNEATYPIHLLDLLRTKLIGNWQNEQKHLNRRLNDNWKNEGKHHNCRWCSFRNISELQNAGIKMKSSKEGSLKIRFEKCFIAKLYLPTLTVDDSMMPKFLNLIAYEMCPDFHNSFDITSYICFMDRLIDSPNDVKLLRDAKVLHNELGSDQKVAKIFNAISTDMVPNNKIYDDVISDIQHNYEDQCSTWMAQVYYSHFSSPWTIIGFFAVIFELVMNFLQTWNAIRDDNKSVRHRFE